MNRSATLSACGRFRYHLQRDWTGAGETPRSLMMIMLNPSTADASADDPTIRRCVGFALAWGFTQLNVVNLFAFRTPSPAALRTAWDHGADVVGPENDATISCWHLTASKVVFAWGAFDPGARHRGAFEARKRKVVELVKGRDLTCIGGLTANGSPRHPLYLRADEHLVSWRPA